MTDMPSKKVMPAGTTHLSASTALSLTFKARLVARDSGTYGPLLRGNSASTVASAVTTLPIQRGLAGLGSQTVVAGLPSFVPEKPKRIV
jgi:hypothetical protein